MAKKITQSNFLTDVEIKNFKSIKHLKFKPKRVNLFIGKPNSGKSNLLEALSLLGEPYLYSHNNKDFFKQLLRFERTIQLYYNLNQTENILIHTNLGNASIRHIKSKNENKYEFLIAPSLNDLKKFDKLPPNTLFDEFRNYYAKINSDLLTPHYKEIDETGKITEETSEYNNRITDLTKTVKKYEFTKIESTADKFSLYLKRCGENLYTILESNEYLRNLAGNFFEEYNIEFIMISDESRFVIQKRMGKVAYQLPITMTPDTFQRLIYYMAAIYSNNNAVLLFEEPEAHSFPPYIARICELIGKKRENQYFISTHSPYVYQSIVSNTNKNELAVWALSYSKDQTKMVQLTEKQIGETLSEGVDIFQNIDRYTK